MRLVNYTILVLNWGLFLLRKGLNVCFLFTVVDSTIVLKSQHKLLTYILTFFYYSSYCQFKILFDFFFLDFLGRTLRRFEGIFGLLSIFFSLRLFVCFRFFDNAVLDSLGSLYHNLFFFECEIWDFYGISFSNCISTTYHIFLDFGFKGYPLRKDFIIEESNQLKVSYISNSLLLWGGFICGLRNRLLFYPVAWYVSSKA